MPGVVIKLMKWSPKTQQILEGVFIVCRVLITYAAMTIFLALPPVVKCNQAVAAVLNDHFTALAVPVEIPDSTKREATDQAMLVVWLGRASASLFSAAEVEHLLDVHKLLIAGGVVAGLAISSAVLTEKYAVRLWVARVYRRLALMAMVFSFFAFFFFEPLFSLFHTVVFPQGNYAFSVESIIIQTFPPVFWLWSFVLLQLGVVILLYLQARHAEILEI